MSLQENIQKENQNMSKSKGQPRKTKRMSLKQSRGYMGSNEDDIIICKRIPELTKSISIKDILRKFSAGIITIKKTKSSKIDWKRFSPSGVAGTKIGFFSSRRHSRGDVNDRSFFPHCSRMWNIFQQNWWNVMLFSLAVIFYLQSFYKQRKGRTVD